MLNINDVTNSIGPNAYLKCVAAAIETKIRRDLVASSGLILEYTSPALPPREYPTKIILL
jgi:hypothetical protein